MIAMLKPQRAEDRLRYGSFNKSPQCVLTLIHTGHVNENGEKYPFITKTGIFKKTNHIQPDLVTVCSSTKPCFDVGKLQDFLKWHCVNYATESCEQKHFSDWPHGICISMSFPFRRGIFKKSLAHNLPQISSKKILSCVCCGCNSCYMEWICFFFIMLIVLINGQMVHCNELWDGMLSFPFIKDSPSVSYAKVDWSLLFNYF